MTDGVLTSSDPVGIRSELYEAWFHPKLASTDLQQFTLAHLEGKESTNKLSYPLINQDDCLLVAFSETMQTFQRKLHAWSSEETLST